MSPVAPASHGLLGRIQQANDNAAHRFGPHTAEVDAFIPLAGADVLDPKTRRFIARIQDMTRDQLVLLAKRWRIEPTASRALLQAVAKNRQVKSEEAVALSALGRIPNHVTGDEGWSAVRTVVHGGRVLGAMGDLTPQEIVELWAPLQATVPLASLDEVEPVPAVERVRAAVDSAIKTITRPPRSRAAASRPVEPAIYGANHAEVAGFIKGVAELSPIQWLRVIDRRKLVASVTREGSLEPAGVVRSILAAIEGARELDMFMRCRVFAAVERAGFAIESHARLNLEDVRKMLAPFEPAIAFGDLNGD